MSARPVAARRTPGTPQKPAGSAAAGARARTVPGATRTAILAALSDGSAMTAGAIAAATGLARATVSSTLSKLATSGEIQKAVRGYQLARESDTTRRPARPRPGVGTVATSASRQAAEPPAADHAEPPVAEPTAAPPTPDPKAAAPSAVDLQAAGATAHAVLEALADGSVMTAGEMASATGLGREHVSATLSQLADAGELTEAARGYQLAGVEPEQRFYLRNEDYVTPRAVVANVSELEAAIAVCGPEVLRRLRRARLLALGRWRLSQRAAR